MEKHLFEIRLIGIFSIAGCPFCEQGRKLGEILAHDAWQAKQAAIEEWPDARISEIYAFRVSEQRKTAVSERPTTVF